MVSDLRAEGGAYMPTHERKGTMLTSFSDSCHRTKHLADDVLATLGPAKMFLVFAVFFSLP